MSDRDPSLDLLAAIVATVEALNEASADALDLAKRVETLRGIWEAGYDAGFLAAMEAAEPLS